MKRYLIPILILVILSGCFKEDEIVVPDPPGDVITESIGLTQDYRYQVYYDLEREQVVSENLKKNWDLGFEGDDDGSRIILNTSLFMLAANTSTTDFASVTDTTGLDWQFDKSDGDPDSAVFRSWARWSEDDQEWSYTNHVYVINRGFDELGNELGLKKIVFTQVTDTSYSFLYANMDGTGQGEFTIRKDPAVNFVHFSFNDGGQQLVQEPDKETWSILFTQYTTLLYTDFGDPYPYLVTGALINPVGISVARDTLAAFGSIDLDYALGLDYKTDMDYIGYDWKDVEGDVSTGNVTYVVMEGLNYLIRDAGGFYYKLRFISFYNNSGEKGYPTFEFQRL